MKYNYLKNLFLLLFILCIGHIAIWFGQTITKKNIMFPIFFEIKEIECDIAVLTAIFGIREKNLKKVVKQYRLRADFFCFTDNESLLRLSPWIVFSEKFHNTIGSDLDNGRQLNSIKNNYHPYNIYKYYKMQFFRFPFLQKYRIVIWVDSSIEIVSDHFLEVMNSYYERNSSMVVAAYEHHKRKGLLRLEVRKSQNSYRWRNTVLFGIPQPKQNIGGQWKFIKSQGYNDKYWKDLNISQGYGVWTTGLLVWNMKNPLTKTFLNEWYLQNLVFSTQCQISFSYVAFKYKVHPMVMEGESVYVNSVTHFIGHGK